MDNRYYVALGSNLGNRAGYLASAISAISLFPETRVLSASAIEETAPLSGVRQPPYLNQMIALQTALTPHELLRRLQAVEQRLGRVRTVRWGSRTLDLDIVLHVGDDINDDVLTIPHPGLDTRDFWQREVAELNATLGTT